jgi:phosphomannomutase / phosphoglucomutase
MTTTAPLALEDAWKPCDLRGRYPDVVSSDLFRNIGGAIGTMLPASARVVVAGDFRLSTAELKHALTDGLLHTGVRVLDAGQCPTPLAYFAAQRLEVDAVLIVTASHNPPAHNGLKLMLGAAPTYPKQLIEIRKLAESRAFRMRRGSVKNVNPRPLYARTMLERWDSLRHSKPARVVLDAGNGAWSELAPDIFRRLGCEVKCISCVVDGNFPDRPSDCASEANLARLRRTVKEQEGSIGIAWDGDGDRVAFVDEEGSYVTPDEIAILLTRAVLEMPSTKREMNRKIVVDVKCSDIVRREITSLSGTPLLERTGHAFMRSRMVAEEALLGLDACGHYFFQELQGGDDGLFAALFLLNLVQGSGKSLAELRRALPPIFSTPELRIPAASLTLAKAAAALRAEFSDASVLQMDGFRFVLDDGIILVRESGTEPVISLRIEGFEHESFRRILAQCLHSLPEAKAQVYGARDPGALST